MKNSIFLLAFTLVLMVWPKAYTQESDRGLQVIHDTEAEAGELPLKLSLLWDTSYSMDQRNLAAEIRFLDALIRNVKNLELQFQPFGYRLDEPMVFQIVAGDWAELREVIENTTHDGATDPALLKQLQTEGLTLLFTDGRGFPWNVFGDREKRIFTISSQKEADHEVLTQIALRTGANYLPLYEVSDISLLLKAIDQPVSQEQLFKEVPRKSDIRQVKGSVTDFDDTLSNVIVQVRGTERKSQTDALGNFDIPANTSEIIDFYYPGRQGTHAIVNNPAGLLKITMPLNVKVLDEVVLEQDTNPGENGNPLKDNVITNFGLLDARKTGFAIKQIRGEQLIWSTQSITEALRGKFPGIRIIGGSGLNARVMLRAGSRAPAAWDVDGIQYSPENPPLHINIQNIESITVMPGSWAAARYGSMAAGGIVMVRTISQSVHTPSSQNALQRRDNYYKEDAASFVRHNNSPPVYLRELSSVGSLQEAYKHYLKLRPLFDHRAGFFFDIQKWFDDQEGGEGYADRILSNLQEVFHQDPAVLKIAAYSMESKGHTTEALSVYQRIHEVQPNSQSLRDLARMYYKTGNLKRAWNLYSYYLAKNDSLYARGTDRIVREEMLGLLKKHGPELGFRTTDLRLDDNQNDLSLLVEWNNPNTRFELQFVGPEGLFYRWNNEVDMPDKNSLNGYMSEVFDIADISHGSWKVNTRYLGNQENTPSFVKFTIKDHRKESEEIRLLKLETAQVNLRFLDINAGEIVTAMP